MDVRLKSIIVIVKSKVASKKSKPLRWKRKYCCAAKKKPVTKAGDTF